MRHGATDPFLPDGTPLRPDRARLSVTGAREARAAGALFAACGVQFDRVATSGLPPAVETARQLMQACGAALPIEEDPALRGIEGGPLDLAPDGVDLAFLGPFLPGRNIEAQRFGGGESIGELLDRVLPAFGAWLLRDDWRTLLLVLHGAVNRALLSTALVGERAFFGRMEQDAGCINVLDAGRRLAPRGDARVRAINLLPSPWLRAPGRRTMDQLLAHYEPATV